MCLERRGSFENIIPIGTFTLERGGGTLRSVNSKFEDWNISHSEL